MTMARGVKNQDGAAEAADRKHARFVRATAPGYYGQLRDTGDVFENALDLPTQGSTWLEPAEPKAGPAEE